MLHTDNLVSSGRHPKKPIADALRTAVRDGLRVDEAHKAHRWGVLVCTRCGNDLPIYSSPRIPEYAARAIRKFEATHRHEGAQR